MSFIYIELNSIICFLQDGRKNGRKKKTGFGFVLGKCLLFVKVPQAI